MKNTFFLLLIAFSFIQAKAEKAPPNILLICVDDLKPWLGCYGNEFIKTPQMDKLAESGQIFTKHYVQCATCGASRKSMLTSRWPRTYQDSTNGAFKSLDLPENKAVANMPAFFKSKNYTSVSVGKIVHGKAGNLKNSWDRAVKFDPDWGKMHYKERITAKAVAKTDAEMNDGKIALHAVKELRDFKENGKSFFLAVGFIRPHLPFYAPQKYWDMYDPKKLGLADYRQTPKNADRNISLHESFEMRGQYKQLSEEGTEAEEAILRHGYAACVSLIDTQVGLILDELDRLKMRENTIVVLWGDHGWHLGDHGTWGKHTVFEHGLRSPLIISYPGLPGGKKKSTIVESVDIFPTLVELCGFKAAESMDGESLVPLMKNGSKKRKEAFGVLAEGGWRKDRPLGYTLREDRYRVVAWKDRKTNEWLDYVELYDLKNDKNETMNITKNNPEVTRRLLSKLLIHLNRTQKGGGK